MSIGANGAHTVAATWTRMSSDDRGMRQLTFRLDADADSDNEIEWYFDGEDPDDAMYLLADESWTIGPNAGTVKPNEIWIKGEAGNVVKWAGILV